jgi:hypothetical protein
MAVNNNDYVYDPDKREKDRVFVSHQYSTKQLIRQDETLAIDTLIKETKGVGDIEQILLKSDSIAYSLQVIIDNETIWEHPYAFFLANTADIVGVSAYAAGGFHYLSIQNLFFQKDFLIRIRPTESIVWDVILVKYNIRKETILKEFV